MILFFFFPNDMSIISISKRYQNRMGINCFCFPAVAPFIGFVQYRPIPVKSSTFETGERDSELTRYRAFFFSSPPFFDTPVYYSRYVYYPSPPPQISNHVLFRIISPFYVYIYMYISSLLPWGQKNRRENSSDGSTPRIISLLFEMISRL